MGNKTVCAGLAVALSLAAQTPISVQVLNQTNLNAGLPPGRLQSFLSTAFQPAEWPMPSSPTSPVPTACSGSSRPSTYACSRSQQAVPLSQSSGVFVLSPYQWNFNTLNDILLPVLNSGDHSPELQLATAPAYMNDSNGHLLQANFQAFANYCADVVRYYNTGGFQTALGPAGMHYQSPSPYHITWWGIFNEPNINGLTASQYLTLYNTGGTGHARGRSHHQVRGHRGVRLGYPVAGVRSDFCPGSDGAGGCGRLHYYSTCNQKDTDQKVMGTIPGFLADLKYVQSQLQTNPALRNVPVWVTENNVNADYGLSNGMSACNGTPYVTDLRATDAFFAAWRPYLFSQLAQGGNQSLYHWDFDADAEFGEVDYASGNTYLSYWTDYELAHLFPSPPGATILASDELRPERARSARRAQR